MAFPSNPIYKLVNDPIHKSLLNIKAADNRLIPIDENNIDYQKYLEWAKTNTAEAAD
tara:strand:- start:43 stop:213 length:171 start_codon:yes stop_codon:yes gene_type:complete